MVVKDDALRRDFYHWLEVNEFNAPVLISTIGAEAAYRHGGEWLGQMLAYVEENIDFVTRFLEEHVPGVRAVQPEASFLMWLDFRSLGLSQEELMRLMIEKAHLAMNDGAMFGSQGVGFLRLNVGTPRCVLRTALEHIRDAVAAVKTPAE